MLTVNQTISRFLQPVVGKPNILMLQKVLVKSGSPVGNQTMAAIRCLSLLFDLDIASLLMSSVAPIRIVNPTSTAMTQMAPVQVLIEALSRYRTVMPLALTEAKVFLPAPTVDILSEYSSDGSNIYLTGVATFLVLTANLQDL